MSDAPASVQAKASKRAKTASTKRMRAATAEDVLQAEFEAMMERSSQRLAKLNADMDDLLIRLRSSRLTS